MGRPVTGASHILLNRDLFNEFGAFLAAAEWDIALLQEVPPRWDERLAAATGSMHHRALTSRNWMSPVMSPIARKRPHLPGSWEGGSNLILVRKDKPGGTIVTRNNQTLCWRPERRSISKICSVKPSAPWFCGNTLASPDNRIRPRWGTTSVVSGWWPVKNL